MEVMCNNFMPGDSRLVEKLVSELKSQGIFDQFRKECISDVDTKPAYLNLRQRVEGSVSTFLKGQNWSVELNKNQLREQLRKNLQESGFLETGVERIVDQVVNPKINTVFLPKVEEVVYKFLGLENPNRNMKREPEVPLPDPLPTDLEAISPGSVQGDKLDLMKEDGYLLMNPTETSMKLEDDEQSHFESHQLDSNENGSEKMNVDENTRDSHLSGFSGLESHGSNLGSDNRIFQMDISNQDSQISQNSSESHLSIITSDDTSKMDISEDSNTILKSEKAETVAEDEDNISPEYEPIDKETVKLEKYENKFDSTTNSKNKDDEKCEKKTEKNEEKKTEKNEEKKAEKNEEKKAEKNEEKKVEKNEQKKAEKIDEKKSKSNEKSSKDYKRDDKKDDTKDDKHRKSSSSSSREKDRTSSKYHSSSKDKDKKDSRSSSSHKDKDKNKGDKEKIDKDNKSSKHKEKSDKEKSKTEKEKSDKDKSKSDRTKTEKEHANKAAKDKSEKEKSEKEKSDRGKEEKSKSKSDKYKSDKDKYKSERDKSNKDKDKSDKDKSSKEKDKYRDKSYKSKEKSDKDKEKSSKEKSSRDRSSSRKDSKEKKEESKESNKEIKEKLKDDGKEVGRDKGRSSSSSSKQNSTKDKKPSTPKKESYSHKEKASPGDLKYKNSSEKGKKDEGTVSSNKKDKDESKKKSKDDHYSYKIKKSERRSTDRDSNDGQSSKNVFNSYSESTSSKSGNNSQDYSSSSITSGSGDSGNSDQTEMAHAVSNGPTTTRTTATIIPVDPTKLLHELPKVRYIKPKFAMNFEEARKIMKIRKQLAMLERQNQLSLARIEVPIQNGITNGEVNDDNNVENPQNEVENKEEIKSVDISEEKENINTSRGVDDTVIQAEIDKKSVNKVDNVKEVLYADKFIEDPKITVSKIEGRDISKENWEALEAKLAQVMSEVDYNSYDSDDDFEFHGYSSIDIIPKQLIDVNRDLVKKTEEEILKNENDTNIRSPPIQQSRLHNPCIPNSDDHIVSNVFNNSTNSNRNVQDSPPSSSEKAYTREVLNANVKNKQLSEALSDGYCRFLEEPSCDEENYLRGLKMLISRMEIDVEQYAENLSNNIWPSKRGTKRKLEEHVDIKNNNKSLYMETVKKRRGSASSVTVTPIAGKKRLSNSTDITPAEHFSLPLSPAESDKSNERKDEDLVIPIKQKRIMREYTQRYSSDDLYKPRPVFGGRRKKQS